MEGNMFDTAQATAGEAVDEATSADLPDGYYRELPQYLYDRDEAIRRSHLEWIGSPPTRPDRYYFFASNPDQRPTFEGATLGAAYHCRINEPQRFDATYRVVERKTAQLKAEHGEEHLLNFSEADLIESCQAAFFSTDEICNLYERVETFESALFWRCFWTGLRRKARLDWYLPSLNAIADLKLVRSIDEHALSRAIAEHGYHRQAATYLQGARACGLDVEHFIFVFQEKTAPHATRILQLDEEAIDLGERQVRAQMCTLQLCMSSDEWPAPSSEGIKKIGLPRWVSVETDRPTLTE
jgi:hypothetical protein